MKVCVFCGSSPPLDAAHADAARALGAAVAGRGLGLVYGGARVGLMGLVADAALEAGGEVVGVLPRGLFSTEVPHEGLSEMHLTDGMLERKSLMADLSDAFVALPGGMGTLDELFEMLTWSQLDLHARPKPTALLAVGDFWDPLLGFLDRATTDGYIRPAHRELLVVESDPAALLDALVGPGAPR